MSAQMVSLMEYRYKKYAKVSGEIDLRQDITYRMRKKTDLRKEYIKSYLQLLTNFNK